MPKEKFNPIAQLPILPGTEIASDEAQSNIIDSTYPPADSLTEESLKKAQIQIRVKPTVAEEVPDQTPESKRVTAVRMTILISLIVLVFAGILLTFQLVPRIMNGFSGAKQSLGTLFTSRKTTTSTSTEPSQAPAFIPLVATSTPISQMPDDDFEPIAARPIAPARLVANVISTEIIGNRVVAVFNVENVGEVTSGPWSFSANLPSSATPVYHSVLQRPLAPRSGIINTLEFDADFYLEIPVQVIIYY